MNAPRRSLRGLIGELIRPLIVATPLAIGTVHEATQTIAYAFCCFVAGLAIYDAYRRQRALPLTWPMVIALVLVGATLLQLVPLPQVVIATLSPRADEIYQMSLGPDYGWHAISLDPAATLHEAGKLAALTCFLLAATYYASRESRRRKLLIAVATASALAAVLGLAQLIAGSSKVLFFYEPSSMAAARNAVLRGPFVNPNHMGALLSLGAAASLAIGLREPRYRVAAFSATVLMNIAAVLTLSRSTFVTVPLAQGLTYALERWRARGGTHWSSERAGQRVTAVLLIVGAITVTVVLQLDAWRKEVEHTDREELAEFMGDSATPWSKMTLWKEAGELAWAYPWTGAGRGSFSQGITQFSEEAGAHRFLYAENTYVQVIADWGIPVALLVLLLAALAFRTTLATLRPDPIAAGAVAGLVALGVHDVADFSIEIVGIAIPALALVAILGGAHAGEKRGGSVPVPAKRSILAFPLATAAVAAFALFMPTAEAAFPRLQKRVGDPATTVEQVTALGTAYRHEHPADYRGHAVIARALASRREPSAIRWLNEAIFLNPQHPSLHLIAGELLADSGHASQAFVEYRLAVASTSHPEVVWNRAAERFNSVPELLSTTKTPGERVLLSQWLARRHRREDALTVYQSALELDPFNAEALLGATRLAVVLKDGKNAVSLAKRLQERAPDAESRLLLARAYVLDGQLPRAAKVLDDNGDRTSDGFGAEVSLIGALIAANDLVTARSRLEGLTWATERLEQAQVHELRSRIEKAAGNRVLEQMELEKAASLRGPRGQE